MYEHVIQDMLDKFIIYYFEQPETPQLGVTINLRIVLKTEVWEVFLFSIKCISAVEKGFTRTALYKTYRDNDYLLTDEGKKMFVM